MPNGSFQQRPDSGALFGQKQATEKHPAIKGKALLSPGLVASLMAQVQAGMPAEIEIAGWNYDGAKGPYLSIKVGLPYQSNQGGGVNGPGPSRAPVRPAVSPAFPVAPPSQRPQPQRSTGPAPAWDGVDKDELPF